MSEGRLALARLALAALLLSLWLACSRQADEVALMQPVSKPVATATQPLASAGVENVLASLSRAEVLGVVEPDLRAALEDMRRRANEDLGSVLVTRADQATWGSAALGCPEPNVTYDQALTPGTWLVLVHRGTVFDYRVADGDAVRCVRESDDRPLMRQPLDGVWSTLAPMPTPRSEVAAAELRSRIYVMGGFGVGATANEEYDPETNTWRRRDPIPEQVNHAAAVALDGKVYLIGGFDNGFRPIDRVWSYEPATDSWTSLARLSSARGALAAAVVDGKIYAIGGRMLLGDVGTTDVYDPATHTWSPLSPMPTPRDHVAVAVVDGVIYVIGGRLETFARNLDANESYDPSTDTWARLAPLPTVRSGIAAGVVGGAIYVFGGEEVAGTFDTAEWYHPGTDEWVLMTPMPTARHGLGAVALGGRVYVLAGGPTPGGSESALNEVYVPFARGR